MRIGEQSELVERRKAYNLMTSPSEYINLYNEFINKIVYKTKVLSDPKDARALNKVDTCALLRISKNFHSGGSTEERSTL